MNLYRISQNVNDGYDTYDAAVVAAASEEEARRIHPGSAGDWYDLRLTEADEWEVVYTSGLTSPDGEWASPRDVTVRYLGVAAPDIASGVICASFNAG